MASFLDSTGLTYLLGKIKNAFVAKADTTTVTSISIDSTPTANSNNLVTSGGVYTAIQSGGGGGSGTLNTTNTTAQTTSASESLSGTVNLHKISKTGSYDDLLNKPTMPTTYADSATAAGSAKQTEAIPFGRVASTSTAKVFTASVPGITELKDGTCVLLKNGVVTSAAGCTLNINGLGAKPIFSNLTAATRDTTIFNINYTMLFVYDSTRVVDSITGAWCCYRGYDANTNTIGYQLRTNSYSKPMANVTFRYRLLFSSANNEKWVPANTSSSTNDTASRTVNQTPINPFGEIVYYGTTTSVVANSRPSASALWQEYTLSLGYSFNRTGAALTLTSWKPVYVKCAPQSDGSAIMDSTTPYVQALPTTDDGKIYIFLGVAYSATAIELTMNHPVFYYKDGAIKEWTGPETNGGMAIVTASGNTLTAHVNTYYRFDTPVTSLTIILPLISNPDTINSIVFSLTTGASPTISFDSIISVYAQDGYSIEGNTSYEINAIYNGSTWVVAAIKINTTNIAAISGGSND